MARSLRRPALCLRAGEVIADARAVADELNAAYGRRREADLERLELLVGWFSGSVCFNEELERYFTGEGLAGPCGCCEVCCGAGHGPVLPPLPPRELTLPDERELPRFDSRVAAPPLFAGAEFAGFAGAPPVGASALRLLRGGPLAGFVRGSFFTE